jgi:hypothetical protein
MKATIETDTMSVYMLLPNLAFIYEPDYKEIQIGFYFLNFSLTIKISKK